MTRFVLDVDDSQWKADHLPRVLRTAESEWLEELACQVEIQIADARSLVVLDLKNDLRREYVVEILRENRHSWTHDVADQIEAQTKPAKIEEPEQGKRVEANLLGFQSWNEYLHIGIVDEAHWVRLKDGNVYTWGQLTNPQVVES